MKSLRRTIAAFAAACLMSVALFAADASGTWKWTVEGRGGQPREQTLTLTVKEGKVTGKLTSPGRDGAASTVDISDGAIKGDVVTFNVERAFNDMKFVTKYSGKLEGDTITGESQFPGRDGGDPVKRPWVAKRSK